MQHRREDPRGGLGELGDTSPEEFRRQLHELADWIADFRHDIESLRVAPNDKHSESKTKTEMERAEIFIGTRIGIDAVVETNRTDWQLVAQARAYGIAHIAYANVL